MQEWIDVTIYPTYILYPLDLPEVRPLTYRVYSGVGQATQLSCRVMGYPQPVVSWFFLTERGRQFEVRHDTMHTYSTDGDVHTLTISHLAHNQLTNFTCRAQNEVGFNQGHIEVTGNDIMLLKGMLGFPSENITFLIYSWHPLKWCMTLLCLVSVMHHFNGCPLHVSYTHA